MPVQSSAAQPDASSQVLLESGLVTHISLIFRSAYGLGESAMSAWIPRAHELVL